MASRNAKSSGSTGVEKVRMERLTLDLDASQKKAITPDIGRGYAGVIRSLIDDSLNLFGLPAPIREVLEVDMRERGIPRQRDYVLWLLLERERSLREKALRAQPVSGAA